MPKTIAELKQQQDAKDAANARPGEQHQVTENTWEVSIPKTRIHTLEQLVEYCQIDLTTWQVERFTANKWEMGAKNQETNKIEVEPLFQIKAFLKRKVAVVEVRKEIEALKVLGTQLLGKLRFPGIKQRPPESGNMLELMMPDIHFGKLSWGIETGGPNYDTNIAVELYWRAFDTLLSRVTHHKIDKVLFVVGNDLMNTDNPEGRTTAGTYVSTDGRYEKTFSIVRDLKIQSVLRLRHHFQCPVQVVMVRGNHDSQSVWHLGDSIEMFFHNCPDVTIDNSPRTRKYVQWGLCMVMLTHGNRGKRPDYPLTMATEQPRMFGATKFREAHTGHNHKKFVDEFHGVRVRIFSALCPEDAWHADNNFVGNLRCAEVVIWNKDEGIIGSAEFTDFEREPDEVDA